MAALKKNEWRRTVARRDAIPCAPDILPRLKAVAVKQRVLQRIGVVLAPPVLRHRMFYRVFCAAYSRSM